MPKTKTVYRTAIYARLSKDDGDKAESNSIASQKALCEEYITKHSDLELVETFVDDGYSGVDFERPAFHKMEDALRQGKVDAVLCKDLSRFSRNYIEGGRYLEKVFPMLGVRFIAINDSYDTLTENPQSHSFLIPFKNLINDSYCKDISVKIRTNLDVKRRKGEYVGSYTPYGYRKDPQDKNRLIVDEEAGETVRQIFSLYKDGMSIGQIADHLNELGVQSPMEHKIKSGIRFETSFKTGEAAKWSYNAVRRILTNEVYIGILAQGKRGTPNYKVHVVQKRDESDWIRVEDTHAALVTYDDFMAVRNMLDRDVRIVSTGREVNPFSGFLFCGDCGQPMIRKVVSAKDKKYYYFVCSTHKRHEGCSPHSMSATELTRTVKNAIASHISHILDLSRMMDYIAKLPSANRLVMDYEAQTEKLEEEIEYLHRMKLRIYEDLTSGILDKQEYADFRQQYKIQIEEKSAALENLRREKKNALLTGETEKVWVALFRQHENIEEVNRRVLMALIDKIFIYEGHTLEVVFRYRDEYQRMSEFVEHHAELLPSVTEETRTPQTGQEV